MFTQTIPALSEELKMVYAGINRLAGADSRNDLAGEILRAVCLSSGKGYRPSLLLLTAKMGDRYEERKEALCHLAALVEYVHMASLVHDDIVDDSPMRRGAATIQARFGKDMAVFTGDLMLGQVMKVLLEENYRESGLLIAQTVRDMCVGEIGQADCLFDCETGVEQYYRNIFGKTASIFVTACKVGAIESGCDEKTVELMGKAGLNLGYLFQIRDDLLDFLPGDTNEGKMAHQDFREGIMTLPVLYAMNKAHCREGIKRLCASARKGTLSDEQIAELNDLISDGGGFRAAINDASYRRDEVISILNELKPCEALDLIKGLTLKLTLPEIPGRGDEERNIA